MLVLPGGHLHALKIEEGLTRRARQNLVEAGKRPHPFVTIENPSCNRLNKLAFIPRRNGARFATTGSDQRRRRFLEGSFQARHHAHVQIEVVKKATFGLPPVGSPHFRRLQAALC